MASDETKPAATTTTHSGTAQRFVERGGVRYAVPFPTPKPPEPPKPKPPKTTYKSEFEGRQPPAEAPGKPKKPTKPQSTASSITFEDPNHPTKPREQFATTYATTIARK